MPEIITPESLLKLRACANELLRPPAGYLKHPFLVPGSLYSAEQWDWDSYWTARGLINLAQELNDSTLLDQVIVHGQGTLRNLFEHQASNGALAIMMTADNPDMFGCLREDGPEVNQAKPIVGQFALCLSEASHDFDWFLPHLDSLNRFFNRWDSHYKSHIGLLVWGSDVAIGVDNDPTTYGRPDFSSANLLVNCLFVEDLQAAAIIAEKLNHPELAAQWSQRADELAGQVAEQSWDSRDRFFYTQDVQCRDRRAELIPWATPGMPLSWKSLPVRIQSFTGFLPLWCGAARGDQAEAMLKHVENPETFCADHGVRSLSKAEPMFSLVQSNNPSNWLGPIWIVANYFVWSGLRRYGFHEAASDLATRILGLLEDDLASHGALHEYYHPDTGAPIMNKGFLSWNYLACEIQRVENLSKQPVFS